jgi:hypothetical protein
MKNNMKWLILIFILINSTGFAQIRPELFQEEENFEKLTNDEVRIKKDITLRDEAIISDTNVYTGIKDFEYYTAKDHHRLAGNLQLNPHITKLVDFSTFEINYAYKGWGLWWHGFLNRSAGTWESMAENKDPNGTSETSEGHFQRPKRARETLYSYGAGVGYRFKMIYEWIKLDDLFETVAVYGVKHNLSDSYRDITYNGYGFRADYGLHMRATSSFFYGLKGSYNIGKVTRSLQNFESHSEGSLALSWVSVGFELGYYY